jgi:hypothetical protein
MLTSGDDLLLDEIDLLLESSQSDHRVEVLGRLAALPLRYAVDVALASAE